MEQLDTRKPGARIGPGSVIDTKERTNDGTNGYIHVDILRRTGPNDCSALSVRVHPTTHDR